MDNKYNYVLHSGGKRTDYNKIKFVVVVVLHTTEADGQRKVIVACLPFFFFFLVLCFHHYMVTKNYRLKQNVKWISTGQRKTI